MNDYAIRQALKEHLRALHAHDESLIVEELGLLEGEARADLAVINGKINGFEIKSEKDTLVRLPRQREAYGKLFDTVTLVVSKNHLSKARNEVPKWWGIIVATEESGSVKLKLQRPAKDNLQVTAIALLRLVWKPEALAILEAAGLARGMRSKSRDAIWNAIAAAFSLDDIKRLVRDTIKARGDWRAAARQKSGGGLSRRNAKSLDYQPLSRLLHNHQCTHPQN